MTRKSSAAIDCSLGALSYSAPQLVRLCPNAIWCQINEKIADCRPTPVFHRSCLCGQQQRAAIANLVSICGKERMALPASCCQTGITTEHCFHFFSFFSFFALFRSFCVS